jgi:hypothetical protein
MTGTVKSKSRLDVSDAIHAAQEFGRHLFPKCDLTLEEIEATENERYWLITLGVHSRDLATLNHIRKELPFLLRPADKLKVFKVDSATGRVVSVKIR